MDEWLLGACDYIASWLEFQMRLSRLPGCIAVVMQRDQIAFERAYGSADLAAGEPLTPRHHFRIASHSKAFTASGIMKLREAGKLRLDDPIGEHVKDLHPRIGEATISQVLSHSAGSVRDGADAGYYEDRRPFPNVDQLMADLQDPPVIEPNTRHKYSNHGFALLGLVIEAITAEPYRAWVTREIIGRGLRKRLHRRRSALMIGERATFPKPPVGVLIRALRSGRSRSVKSRPW